VNVESLTKQEKRAVHGHYKESEDVSESEDDSEFEDQEKDSDEIECEKHKQLKGGKVKTDKGTRKTKHKKGKKKNGKKKK